MHYFKYADKDATIYEMSTSLNTGLDEILAISKQVDSANVSRNTRAVVYFDLTAISTSKASGLIVSESYFLNLFTSNAYALPLAYTLQAFPLSLSFEMGSGYSTSNPAINNGVSWLYRDGDELATKWPTSSFAVGSTGSWATSVGGAVWYINPSASQNFEYETSDVRMDVTNIVLSQSLGIIPNNGFIIKRTDAEETGSAEYGTINFFSTDTHTIYIPRLEVVWDDSVIASGSATGSSVEITSSAVVSIKNLNSEYRTGTTSRFRISTRPMWITKTFVTQSQYAIPYMLPTASYYSIRDAKTDDIVIPFDSYTRLSRDNQGSYFNMWLNAFQPERFYRILIQTTIDSSTQIFDNVATFKVIR
jgi:hypothetical protein